MKKLPVSWYIVLFIYLWAWLSIIIHYTLRSELSINYIPVKVGVSSAFLSYATFSKVPALLPLGLIGLPGLLLPFLLKLVLRLPFSPPLHVVHQIIQLVLQEEKLLLPFGGGIFPAWTAVFSITSRNIESGSRSMLYSVRYNPWLQRKTTWKPKQDLEQN